MSSQLKNLNLTLKVGLQWILSKYVTYILTFDPYLTYEYQHLSLPGVKKQSLHTSLFLHHFPSFVRVKCRPVEELTS